MAGAWPGNRVPADLLGRSVLALAVALGLVLLGQAVFRRLSGRFAQEL